MMTKTNQSYSLFIFFSGLFLLGLLAAIWSGTYYLVAVPFAILFFYGGWQDINAVFFLLLCSLPFSAEIQFTATLGTDFPVEPLMLFTADVLFFFISFFIHILPYHHYPQLVIWHLY